MKIPNNLFYCSNTTTYPPFKHGLYLEEYFFKFYQDKGQDKGHDKDQDNDQDKDQHGRLYIPALWTNFQIQPWFEEKRHEMQASLDEWLKQNPNILGYFVVVQHDDGPLLTLPPNTHIYGSCTGHTPIPLIYQDTNHTLLGQCITRNYAEKTVMCSFVGTNTHPIREKCVQMYGARHNYVFQMKDAWSDKVSDTLQQLFIDITKISKFALAPRGYGRSSFRFFECFQLGAIPVYIWSDKEWLPYMKNNQIDYEKICVSIHESEIDMLDTILENISEKQYQKMWTEYDKIKHMFELDYVCENILVKR